MRAAYPFSKELISHLKNATDLSDSSFLHTAAVCVYPSRVKDAFDALSRLKKIDEIQIAAGNFFLNM